MIIPNGTKVRHKARKGVYAIILGSFEDDYERFYWVDVYSERTNVLQYHKGNWMEDNCIVVDDFKNNIQAKKLLEADY